MYGSRNWRLTLTIGVGVNNNSSSYNWEVDNNSILSAVKEKK